MNLNMNELELLTKLDSYPSEERENAIKYLIFMELMKDLSEKAIQGKLTMKEALEQLDDQEQQ